MFVKQIDIKNALELAGKFSPANSSKSLFQIVKNEKRPKHHHVGAP